MAYYLAFRGFVRVTSFGRFSDLDWALDTTVFNNLSTLRLLCPAGLSRRANPCRLYQ